MDCNGSANTLVTMVTCTTFSFTHRVFSFTSTSDPLGTIFWYHSRPYDKATLSTQIRGCTVCSAPCNPVAYSTSHPLPWGALGNGCSVLTPRLGPSPSADPGCGGLGLYTLCLPSGDPGTTVTMPTLGMRKPCTSISRDVMCGIFTGTMSANR